MLDKLTTTISNRGFLYTLITLERVDVEFISFSVGVIILDDKYRVFMFNNNDNKIVEFRDYKYPRSVITYIDEYRTKCKENMVE